MLTYLNLRGHQPVSQSNCYSLLNDMVSSQPCQHSLMCQTMLYKISSLFVQWDHLTIFSRSTLLSGYLCITVNFCHLLRLAHKLPGVYLQRIKKFLTLFLAHVMLTMLVYWLYQHSKIAIGCTPVNFFWQPQIGQRGCSRSYWPSPTYCSLLTTSVLLQFHDGCQPCTVFRVRKVWGSMPDTALLMTLFLARLLALIVSVSKSQPDFQDQVNNIQTTLLLFLKNLETALSET